MKLKFICTICRITSILALASCSTLSNEYGARWEQPSSAPNVKSSCAQASAAPDEHVQLDEAEIEIGIDGSINRTGLVGPPLLPIMAMEPPLCRMSFGLTIAAKSAPIAIDFSQWELRTPSGEKLELCRVKDNITELEAKAVNLSPGEKRRLNILFNLPRGTKLSSGSRFFIRGILAQSKPLAEVSLPFAIENGWHYCPLSFFCSYSERSLSCAR